MLDDLPIGQAIGSGADHRSLRPNVSRLSNRHPRLLLPVWGRQWSRHSQALTRDGVTLPGDRCIDVGGSDAMTLRKALLVANPFTLWRASADDAHPRPVSVLPAPPGGRRVPVGLLGGSGRPAGVTRRRVPGVVWVVACGWWRDQPRFPASQPR